MFEIALSKGTRCSFEKNLTSKIKCISLEIIVCMQICDTFSNFDTKAGSGHLYTNRLSFIIDLV